MKMNAIFSGISLALVMTASVAVQADDYAPKYSLDSLSHPYHFAPARGHASQNPGSPKWFVPGYGYQIPGFGSPRLSSLAPQSYKTHPFGNRSTPRLGTAPSQHYYWGNGRQPWYLPGAPAAVNRAGFNW